MDIISKRVSLSLMSDYCVQCSTTVFIFFFINLLPGILLIYCYNLKKVYIDFQEMIIELNYKIKPIEYNLFI